MKRKRKQLYKLKVNDRVLVFETFKEIPVLTCGTVIDVDEKILIHFEIMALKIWVDKMETRKLLPIVPPTIGNKVKTCTSLTTIDINMITVPENTFGTVTEIAEDGDLLINFRGYSSKRWVSKEDASWFLVRV